MRTICFFMFFPFRKESELISDEFGTYMGKLNEPEVLDVVNINKQKFEPFAELIETALANLHENLCHNSDSHAQQENDEVSNIIQASESLLDEVQDDAVIFEDEQSTSSILPKNIIYTSYV